MPISTKPGFIYFLRETDLLTGEVSPYVKIGKTDHDRPVAKRIDDHQTGNPREIHDCRSFQVPAIDTVEKHLHHFFAEYGILGEWFYFDEATLATAIKEAEDISSKLENCKNALLMSEENGKIESREKKIEATSSLMELHQEAIRAVSCFETAKARLDLLKFKLLSKMGEKKGINGVVRIIPTTVKDKIDEEHLKIDCPEVFSLFLEEKPTRTTRFTLKNKPSLKSIDPDLVNEIEKLKAETHKTDLNETVLERTPRVEELHLEYLKSMQASSRAEIEKDLLQIRLKAACGNAAEITGICTWPRKQVTRQKFNDSKFKAEHPELATKYTIPGGPGQPRISIIEMRPYRGEIQ